ncbi:MAG: hypothetical protein JSS99_05655 [Actinobacteria bacterium]|nr:hypothetical protein [Actinomycetota bacterium]
MEGRARLPILAIGCVLIAAALAAVLAQSGVRRTGLNRVRAVAQLGTLERGRTLCQRGELVPAGTGAISVSLLAPPAGGGAVRVAVVARDGTTLAGGAAPAGWGGVARTIPLRPVLARDAVARVCVTAAGGGIVGLAGEGAADGGGGRAAIGRRALGGDLRLVYLRAHAASWWSEVATVARRMGAGHPLGGTALAVLTALLLTAAGALAAWQLLRGAQ